MMCPLFSPIGQHCNKREQRHTILTNKVARKGGSSDKIVAARESTVDGVNFVDQFLIVDGEGSNSLGFVHKHRHFAVGEERFQRREQGTFVGLVRIFF